MPATKEQLLERQRLYRRSEKGKITTRRMWKNYKFKIRMECLNHYSQGKLTCKCCNEGIVRFLTIDHENGGGNKHRKEITNGKSSHSGGYTMYLWLRKNKFPSGFQVLCMNCNWGRQLNGGICPHKTEVN